MGWNEEMWDNHSPPISATLCWTQLSPKIKRIAESLCFAFTSWNILADCHAECKTQLLFLFHFQNGFSFFQTGAERLQMPL